MNGSSTGLGSRKGAQGLLIVFFRSVSSANLSFVLERQKEIIDPWMILEGGINEYLQLVEPLDRRLEFPAMHCPKEDVDGVVEVLPNVGLGQVHALLHISPCFEAGRTVLSHIREDAAKINALE